MKKFKQVVASATIAILISAGSTFACGGDNGDGGSSGGGGTSGGGGATAGAASAGVSGGMDGDASGDGLGEMTPSKCSDNQDCADSYIEHFHGRNWLFDLVGLGAWWDEQKKHNGEWR